MALTSMEHNHDLYLFIRRTPPFANWYWRVTNQVAGVAFNEERERE